MNNNYIIYLENRLDELLSKMKKTPINLSDYDVIEDLNNECNYVKGRYLSYDEWVVCKIN